MMDDKTGQPTEQQHLANIEKHLASIDRKLGLISTALWALLPIVFIA